jgi:hypothetical protein
MDTTHDTTEHTTADTAREILTTFAALAATGGPFGPEPGRSAGLVGPLAADETDTFTGRTVTAAMLAIAADVAARHGHTTEPDAFDPTAITVLADDDDDGPEWCTTCDAIGADHDDHRDALAWADDDDDQHANGRYCDDPECCRVVVVSCAGLPVGRSIDQPDDDDPWAAFHAADDHGACDPDECPAAADAYRSAGLLPSGWSIDGRAVLAFLADAAAVIAAATDPVDIGAAWGPWAAWVVVWHDGPAVLNTTTGEAFAIDRPGTEPGPSVYCRTHDLYRPCYWCADPERGTDDDDTARLRRSFDPDPDAAAVLADRGAVSVVAAVLVALVAAVILAACSVVPRPPAPAPAPTAPAVIAEDGPGWSCWHDGNGWCGPVTVVLAHDGTAAVHDQPPVEQMGDTLAASGLPVVFGAVLPDACHGTDDGRDGRGGPGRSGPIASVVVMSTGPTAVVEYVTRSAVIHDGPAGPCVGAIGTTAIY